MCDRTIKIRKGSVLDVNCNTNSIEFTVKGINTKKFGRHIDNLPPDVKNQMEWVKKETETNVNE
jgi:hypothetical protein